MNLFIFHSWKGVGRSFSLVIGCTYERCAEKRRGGGGSLHTEGKNRVRWGV